MLRLWIPLLGLALLSSAADSNRYILELTGDSVAAHIAKESKRTGRRIGMDSDIAKKQRDRILRQQEKVGAALKGLGVEVLGSTQEVSNSLTVRMPEELVGKVKAIPGVKRVRRERTFNPAKTKAGA